MRRRSIKEHYPHVPIRKNSVVIRDDEQPTGTRKIDVGKIIRARLPILTWLPSYNINFFLQDLLAGFTVGLTEIPQGIAYASVAGLSTEYGMYSGIMGGCLYFIFGGCKDINMGPTAIMALFIQSSVATMGPDGAALIAFITGLLIFLAGVLRLGFIVEFFSFPVITGFTTASALSIASSQLKPLLGIKGSTKDFLEAWQSLIEHINETRSNDTILGFTSIACLVIFRELRRFGSLKDKPEWSRSRNILGKIIFYISLGGNALAVVTGTSISYVADKYYNSTLFILTGPVKSGLPSIGLPPFSTTWNGTYFSFSDMLSEYGSLIVFCPMIAFLEHIAIVKAFSKGKFVNATQELIALGIGNMGGSLIHSMPITGSFTRTAVNNASGVRTTTAGLLTSIMLMISLALLTSVFKYIPKATLSAVIMVSMYYLCEFHAIGVIWRTKKLDLIPHFTTLFCCLFISLEYGILIGIGSSMIFVLYDSSRPKLYIEKAIINDNVVFIVQPKVGLHFTSSEYLRNQILKECVLEKSTIVIDGEYIRNIDSTVAKSMADLLDDVNLRNQHLILWNFSQPVQDVCLGDNKKLADHFKSGDLDHIVTAHKRITMISVNTS